MNEIEIIPGIDLGTCNSSIGIWRNNKFEIIKDISGEPLLPSIISLDKDNNKFIGGFAKKQMVVNPDTYYEIKRLIGRNYSDQNVQNNIKYFTFNIEEGPNDSILVSTKNNPFKYTPEEISSFILTNLKTSAEEYLQCKISKVIITVPAYFNDAQRQATRDAATLAGLECIRIINEPTAAALAYGIEYKAINKIKNIKSKSSQECSDQIESDLLLNPISEQLDTKILVYDLGGGTLDVSILSIDDNVYDVLASTGNTFLGGSDFDNYLISWCIKEFEKIYDIKNIELTAIALQSLKKECENAKIKLTTRTKANIVVPNFYEKINLILPITRSKFEEICEPLFKLAIDPIKDALDHCCLKINEIDEIIMVGGATRIPKILDNVYKYFGKMPNCSVNPDEVVTMGAAIQGYAINNKSDPFASSFVLLDITSLSLGIETRGGIMNVIIPRHSKIPVENVKTYTNDTENMKSVTIKVYEGERALVKDNYFVGEFILDGLNPMPTGKNRIKVTFEIDTNGIIKVTAEDEQIIDNKNNLVITSQKGRLSPEKIKEIIIKSNELAEQDKTEQHIIEITYAIKHMCSNILINLNSEHVMLTDDNKQQINTKIVECQDKLNKLISYPLTENASIEISSTKLLEQLKEIHLMIKENYGGLINLVDLDIKSGSDGETNFTEIDDKNINTSNSNEKRIDVNVNSYINICNELVDNVTNSQLDSIAKVECIDSLSNILRILLTDEEVEVNEINKDLDLIINKYDLKFEVDLPLVNILENTCSGIKNIIKNYPESHVKENLDKFINETIDIILVETELRLKNNYDKEKEEIFLNIYTERLEIINNLSKELYDHINSTNIKSKNITEHTESKII